MFFDEAFDGGVYAGPRTGGSAGESWLGPQGALGSFESLLGLTQRSVGAGVRVGEALRGLTEAPAAFWTNSLGADGLATARDLLRWNDTLRLHGWKGEGGQRLEALAAALSNVSPGTAERLERVKERLALLTDVRFSLGLFADPQSLPRRWREVIEAGSSVMKMVSLSPAGEGVGERAVNPSSDDPALQLIRPYGPLVAAESIAAALAASPTVPTVIIGSDPVLDAALRRYGLPTTGAPQSAHDNVLGELLPLVIELGLLPADPHRALELLTIPNGPVRAKVARRLQRALQQWPAVGSPAWRQAIEEVLPELEDDAARKSVKERLSDVFEGKVANGHAYPTAVLLDRAAWMQQWLHGRLAHETSLEGQLRLQAVMGQVALFSNLVDRTSAPELTMIQVRRFLEEAHHGMSTPAAFPRQAGLHSVAAPGGVVAPVERIVWWNYTRSSSGVPRALGLSKGELEQLASAGVVLPTTADLSRRRSASAQRPFLMATQSLWLVCPRHELNGDEATPHSSWDEIAARVKEPRLVSRLVRDEPLLEKPVTKTRRTSLPLPAPVLEWKTNVKILAREKESPSSVEAVLGCSLQWSLNYVARLKSGATATLPTGDTVLGKLAHFVLLERTLRVQHASAVDAADFAINTLREEGPALSARLFLAGATAELGQVEQVLRGAAQVLHELVAAGWRVVETEAELVGSAFGTSFGGVLDLVVERQGRRAVIDLKWGSQKYRRASLEEGTALQLSAYAALLEKGGFPSAPVAYFILTSQAMLSADPTLALGGTAVKTDWTPERTWKLLQKTHEAAWKPVSQGVLMAPGVVAHKHVPVTEITQEGALVMQPPCHFCDFEGLCGRRYGRVEVSDEED